MNDRNRHLLKSWLWALVPLWTLGFGSAAAMVHAAVKKQSFKQAATLPIYLAGLAAVLLFDPDHGSRQEFIFGAGMSVNMGLALVHTVAIRSWVFPSPGDPENLRGAQDRARAATQAAREARVSARNLMANDPRLAWELRIGRPDIPGREYPDGGLVDVNKVDAQTLATHTGLPQPLVDRIITVRAQIGRFASVEEVLHLTNADPRALDAARDYLVFSA